MDSKLNNALNEVESNRENLSNAIDRLDERMVSLADSLAYHLRAPERFVSKNPLLAVGIVLAAGFIVGSRLPSESPVRKRLQRDASPMKDLPGVKLA